MTQSHADKSTGCLFPNHWDAQYILRFNDFLHAACDFIELPVVERSTEIWWEMRASRFVALKTSVFFVQTVALKQRSAAFNQGQFTKSQFLIIWSALSEKMTFLPFPLPRKSSIRKLDKPAEFAEYNRKKRLMKRHVSNFGFLARAGKGSPLRHQKTGALTICASVLKVDLLFTFTVTYTRTQINVT